MTIEFDKSKLPPQASFVRQSGAPSTVITMSYPEGESFEDTDHFEIGGKVIKPAEITVTSYTNGQNGSR